MAASSGLFLATIYNQSQLAEGKHVGRYWSINTAATAVPLRPHPSAITKLAATIFGGPLFGGGTLYRPSTTPVIPPNNTTSIGVVPVSTGRHQVGWWAVRGGSSLSSSSPRTPLTWRRFSPSSVCTCRSLLPRTSLARQWYSTERSTTAPPNLFSRSSLMNWLIKLMPSYIYSQWQFQNLLNVTGIVVATYNICGRVLAFIHSYIRTPIGGGHWRPGGGGGRGHRFPGLHAASA